ncbi:hypothetical protein D3C71_887280 [compost metagenome]
MKKCALCLEKEATETNTHYLTDSIIRRTLNEGGSKERGKTLSFGVSNTSPFTEMSFKENTSPEKLQEALGRETTEEENEASIAQRDYSVDEVFCSACEKRFGKIESAFTDKFLKKLRMNPSLENASEVEFEKDIKIFRLFWLMQVWRSAVCTETVKLSSDISEKLRSLILLGIEVDENELKQFPLSITLLYTGTDPETHTENLVGYTSDTNPILILMGEFVIQFFENNESVRYFDFHGLNDEMTYTQFINYQETAFKVRVLSDIKRKAFLISVIDQDLVLPKFEFYMKTFIAFWVEVTGSPPPGHTVGEYTKELTDFNNVPVGQVLSEERVIDFTIKFIAKKIGLI